MNLHDLCFLPLVVLNVILIVGVVVFVFTVCCGVLYGIIFILQVLVCGVISFFKKIKLWRIKRYNKRIIRQNSVPGHEKRDHFAVVYTSHGKEIWVIPIEERKTGSNTPLN